MFLKKGVLKICIKFTRERPCRRVFSIKLQSNFIQITLRHGCSLVNLLRIFRTPFPKNTSGWLLLILVPVKGLTATWWEHLATWIQLMFITTVSWPWKVKIIVLIQKNYFKVTVSCTVFSFCKFSITHS